MSPRTRRDTVRAAICGALFSCTFLNIGCATPEKASSAGLGIAIGDDLTKVRAALGTSAPLQERPRTPAPRGVAVTFISSRFVELADRGTTVWFTDGGDPRVRRIVLSPPYAGRINGIALGDTVQQLKAKLGEPHTSQSFPGRGTYYRYAVDDSAYVFFEADPAMRITSIVIAPEQSPFPVATWRP
jgi:hypothetical protein